MYIKLAKRLLQPVQRRTAPVRNNMIGARAAQQLLRRRSVVIQLLFISFVGDVVHLIDYIELLNLPKTCLDRKCSH